MQKRPKFTHVNTGKHPCIHKNLLISTQGSIHAFTHTHALPCAAYQARGDHQLAKVLHVNAAFFVPCEVQTSFFEQVNRVLRVHVLLHRIIQHKQNTKQNKQEHKSTHEQNHQNNNRKEKEKKTEKQNKMTSQEKKDTKPTPRNT